MSRGTPVLLAALLIGCASQPPAPELAPLRRDAAAAVEVAGERFANRHYAAAAGSFGRAAEIYGALDDPAAEAAALRNQAEAQRRAGDTAAAAAGFERALALDLAGGRSLAQARDLAGLARCAGARGDSERAVHYAQEALARVPQTDPLRATLEIDLAVHLLARGDAADRERVFGLLAAAGGRASVRNEPGLLAVVQLHLGRAQQHFGSADAGEAALLRALEGFRAVDDAEGVARAHEALGRLMRARGELPAAQGHFAQARRGYELLGDESALRSLAALLAEQSD